MILKYMKVENFGKIDCFEITFDPQITVLSEKFPDDVIKAIGVVTDNQTLQGNKAKQMLSKNTRISTVLEMHGETFKLNFTGIPPDGKRGVFALDGDHSVNHAEFLKDIHLCKEEESLTYYRFDRKSEYRDLLFKYREYDKYYYGSEFSERTDGAGITRSFRAFLAQYIKKYSAEHFSAIGHKIELRPNGKFFARGAGNFKETDNRLFDYACYLGVKEFWEQFENIRNMNYENWPGIVDAAGLLSVPEYKKLFFNRKAQKDN